MLAAGGSRRLGTPKQLLRIRGQRLLGRAIETAEAATPGRVAVVIGADALRLRLLIRRHHPGVHAIANPGWAAGMAGSLQAGLAALPARATAVLLLLSDQPAVDTAAVRRLVRAWRRRPGRAAAAAYGGGVETPAAANGGVLDPDATAGRDAAGTPEATSGGVLGAPAILPRALWKDARRLRGDMGARKLLRAGEAVVTAVTMPEAAWDIDAPEDLRQPVR